MSNASEVFRSQERQEIITVLKGAGEDENGKLHPMSVSQIMAAVERTDRNAVDQMLYKMRKAGEIEVAGRGLYALPRRDPVNNGQIGAPVSAPAQSDQEQSYRNQSDQVSNPTGAEGGKIAVADRLKESPAQPWAISDADAARRAERYRAARKEKGELIATRVLRWELQDAGVLYDRLQREVDRIRQLAGH